MELVFKQSKAVAVTSMSFPHGDVNNFVVGSEDGSVYMACRHGRWVPPKHHRENWGSVFSPPRTERQINVAHSPPGGQIQHSISCWLRFLQPSHPVFLFCLSVMFAKVIQYKQGTHAGETNRSFPVPFFFHLVCVFLWTGELVYTWSSQRRLRGQFHPAMFSFKRMSLASQRMISRVKKRKCGLNQRFQWEDLLDPFT